MFAAMSPNPTPINRDNNKKIFKLIQALLGYEESNIFRKPISHKLLGWEDYRDIIKRPIDINFVRRQNNEGKYKSVEEVLDEIQLVWDNVFIYGKKEHESYELAIKMVKHFDELLRDLFPEYHEKLNRVAYFKQFEPVKPEKKSSNISNSEKNTKKVEKMEVENVKEEIKSEKNLRGSIPTRRREQITNTKNENEEQIPSAEIDNNEFTKKKPESHQKINETKKSATKIHEIEIEVPSNVKEQNRVMENESIISSKKEILENKKPETIEHSVAHSEGQHQNMNQSLLNHPAESFDAEDSQENHYPPILVNLNKTPSTQEVEEITQMMRLLFELEEMETLSKIVKILTKYEKENMIVDGEDVNFRMNEIHISTYSRIRKELEDKINHLEHTEKVKDLNRLKEKLNIKLSIGMDVKINENSKIIEEN